MSVFVLAVAAVAFVVSASAGLGGSLLLVPALCWLLGPKEGIALATLLLGLNNVAKVMVYRATIPVASVAAILAFTVAGSLFGARLMVAAPTAWVSVAVVVGVLASFVSTRRSGREHWQHAAPAFAIAAGALSGFSGTSGPLKGLALRSLDLDRFHFVGAAAVVSLAGDAAKTLVFGSTSLLSESSWRVALVAVPLIPLAAVLGRQVNRSLGERAYVFLFWTVMAGYSLRLLLYAILH